MSDQTVHCARCRAHLTPVAEGPCPVCGYELSQESRRTLGQLPGRTAALLLTGFLGACAVPSETPDASSAGEAAQASEQGGGGAGTVTPESGSAVPSGESHPASEPARTPARPMQPVPVQPYGVPIPPPPPVVDDRAVEGSADSPDEASGSPEVPTQSLEVPPVDVYGMPPMDPDDELQDEVVP